MRRDDAVRILSSRSADLASRFDVAELSLFGSVARDEAKESSDVDLLVSFKGKPSYDNYMELLFFVEDVLGCRVDLVTQGALRKELRPFVEQDAVRVA